MAAYYNEIDPFAAAWLRELIKAGLIADGEVDTRSIVNVRPADLAGFTQCHFFAGIGGWSLALRLAGWADTRKIWTGSCPCQPLSGAGQRKGHADERHLWPAFYSLIEECEIPIIFGEQVASDLGREWCAGVRADLETLGHAFGAADLCAAGIGAPHIRSRLYWVAYTRHEQKGGGAASGEAKSRGTRDIVAGCSSAGVMGHTEGEPGRLAAGRQDGQEGVEPERSGEPGGLGHAEREGFSLGAWQPGHDGAAGRPYPGQGFEQAGTIPILCSDGKFRRVPADQAGEPEPALFPLANAGTVRNRVGLLRGSGNAINPFQARAFIEAACEAIAETA